MVLHIPRSTVYGCSTILDAYDCDSALFTRENIEAFLVSLCAAIDMEREDLHWWDYDDDPEGYAAAPPHLRGISAVQFIKTSSIVVHTLDDLGVLFIDLFSCKRYDPQVLTHKMVEYFKGRVRSSQTFSRMY